MLFILPNFCELYSSSVFELLIDFSQGLTVNWNVAQRCLIGVMA
jgi:hypothetical protein